MEVSMDEIQRMMVADLSHSATDRTLWELGFKLTYSHTGQGLQGTNSKGRSFMRGYLSAKHEQIGTPY